MLFSIQYVGCCRGLYIFNRRGGGVLYIDTWFRLSNAQYNNTLRIAFHLCGLVLDRIAWIFPLCHLGLYIQCIMCLLEVGIYLHLECSGSNKILSAADSIHVKTKYLRMSEQKLKCGYWQTNPWPSTLYKTLNI